MSYKTPLYNLAFNSSQPNAPKPVILASSTPGGGQECTDDELVLKILFQTFIHLSAIFIISSSRWLVTGNAAGCGGSGEQGLQNFECC